MSDEPTRAGESHTPRVDALAAMISDQPEIVEAARDAHFRSPDGDTPLDMDQIRAGAIAHRDRLAANLAERRELRDALNVDIKANVMQLEEAERVVKALTPRTRKAAK